MIVLAVAAATVAAFVASSGYYSLAQPFEKRALGGAALDRGRPTPWQVGAELARTLVLACGYAWLAHAAEMTSLPRGLLLAIAFWVSFPVVLLLGSMTWERAPQSRRPCTPETGWSSSSSSPWLSGYSTRRQERMEEG